jgi:hypothetical protein
VKKSLILLSLIISGCAAHSVGNLQQSCESVHNHFSEMVGCLDTAISSDEKLRSNDRAKLYLLEAKQLANYVDTGVVSEHTARVELQKKLVEFKKELGEALQKAGKAMSDSSNKTYNTNCSSAGNSTNCTTTQY